MMLLVLILFLLLLLLLLFLRYLLPLLLVFGPYTVISNLLKSVSTGPLPCLLAPLTHSHTAGSLARSATFNCALARPLSRSLFSRFPESWCLWFVNFSVSYLGRTDRRTDKETVGWKDRRTDRPTDRRARTDLKIDASWMHTRKIVDPTPKLASKSFFSGKK